MKCQDCKHWVILTQNTGMCRELENDFDYYNNAEHAEKTIKKGKIVCENLYTHRHFGCVNFKKLN